MALGLGLGLGWGSGWGFLPATVEVAGLLGPFQSLGGGARGGVLAPLLILVLLPLLLLRIMLLLLLQQSPSSPTLAQTRRCGSIPPLLLTACHLPTLYSTERVMLASFPNMRPNSVTLKSRSDLWFRSLCFARVCARAVYKAVCFGIVQFLHLSPQPARPTLYAMSDFYRPVWALVRLPHGERHTVQLFASFGVHACVLSFLC